MRLTHRVASLFSLLLIEINSISSALAAPTYLGRRITSVYNLPGDPKFHTSESKLHNAIYCPTGFTKKNTLLIVSGTGTDAYDFFYPVIHDLYPANNITSICYLRNPSLNLDDAQLSSEYVTYAINYLYQSTNSSIRVLSHSQGGPNVLWSITFFPSIRSKIRAWVSMSGDYKGTDGSSPNVTEPIGSLGLARRQNSSSSNEAYPAVLQQDSGSHYVAALKNHSQYNALVPTTNIWTITDELIQPENFGASSSSYLSNATNIPLQSICPTRVVDHPNIVADNIAQYIALQAFSSPNGRADESSILSLSVIKRTQLCAQMNVFSSLTDEASFEVVAYQAVLRLFGIPPVSPSVANMTTVEPALFPYAR